MKKAIYAIAFSSQISLASEPVKTDSSQYLESLELKLAKLWGRFDELDIKVKKQAERIKILEKGLMLGVIPEELLKDKLNLDSSQKVDSWELQEAPHEANPKPTEKAQEKKEETESYNELLKKAQQAFSAGRYGPAIAYYQRIEHSYSKKIAEGQTMFWIGLCWYYLKEYEQAREQFSLLNKSYPSSLWIPKSKFYEGKISLHQGLPGQALRQFNDIISEYPDTDTSEMAAYEIKLLKERL